MGNEIRAECPNCQQPVETDRQTAQAGLTCPSCSTLFVPREIADEILAARPVKPTNRFRDKAEAVDIFCRIAICGAAVMFFYAVYLAIDDRPWWIAVAVGSSLVTLALWGWLFSQLFHLRGTMEEIMRK